MATQDTVTQHEVEIQADVRGDEQSCQATPLTQDGGCQAVAAVGEGCVQAQPDVNEDGFNPHERDLTLFFEESDGKNNKQPHPPLLWALV